jgi:SAM-dependent methyltransferase
MTEPAAPPALAELYLRFTFDIVARQPFEHLHWGDFSALPEEPGYLPQAQAAYTARLLELLPEGARTVLDVGCGLGGTARALVERGLQVTALSPRADHVALLRAAAPPGLHVRQGRFEELELAAAPPHDLVLFAESFNFFARWQDGAAQRSVDATLARCRALLRDGGHVLIAEILRPELAQAIEANPAFEVVARQDISEAVAFTATALQACIERYVVPYHELLLSVVRVQRPELAGELERTLAEVPNQPLRELFAGRMVEVGMTHSQRYLVYLLKLRR